MCFLIYIWNKVFCFCNEKIMKNFLFEKLTSHWIDYLEKNRIYFEVMCELFIFEKKISFWEHKMFPANLRSINSLVDGLLCTVCEIVKKVDFLEVKTMQSRFENY